MTEITTAAGEKVRKVDEPDSEPDSRDEDNPAVAEAATKRETKPEGMPNVWPFHALPRRQGARKPRSEALASFQHVLAAATGLQGRMSEPAAVSAVVDQAQAAVRDRKLTPAVAEITVIASDLEDFLADVLGFLVCVAEDPSAMETWGNTVHHDTLLAGWRWYTATFSPGEALRSQDS